MQGCGAGKVRSLPCQAGGLQCERHDSGAPEPGISNQKVRVLFLLIVAVNQTSTALAIMKHREPRFEGFAQGSATNVALFQSLLVDFTDNLETDRGRFDRRLSLVYFSVYFSNHMSQTDKRCAICFSFYLSAIACRSGSECHNVSLEHLRSLLVFIALPCLLDQDRSLI